MEEFAERVIRFFEALHPLDRVPRAGYLLRGVCEPESVSAHSHFAALLALIFAEQFPGTYKREALLGMALVHDIAEARMMDIPMPVADAYLSGAKRAAEDAIAADMLDGLPATLLAWLREFEAAETPEAKLLRGLDKAQMMIKVLCYDRERRGCLDEFWFNPKNFNDYGNAEVSALFDAICARAGRMRPPLIHHAA
jgi:putative hydrolase of HD superfamily